MGHWKKSKLKSGRYAAPGVWERVLNLLVLEKNQIVLDAPSGQGILSDEINAMGGVAISFDISPNGSSKSIKIRGDLNNVLPFKNNVFEKIICVEGIEHLENPHFLLKEFCRVLKDQGTLILTTPNILNIRSRVKFLFSGCLFWFGDNAQTRFGHITPLSVFQLRYICEKNNFRIEGIFFNRSVFWLSLLVPFVKLLGILSIENFNQNKILSGEILILELVKNNSSYS